MIRLLLSLIVVSSHAVRVAVIGAHTRFGRVALRRIAEHEWDATAVVPKSYRIHLANDSTLGTPSILSLEEFCQGKGGVFDKILIQSNALSSVGRTYVQRIYPHTPTAFARRDAVAEVDRALGASI